MRTTICAGLLVASVSTAHAGCAEALVSNFQRFDFRSATDIAAYQLVRQERQREGKTDISATIPIYGVPVQLGYKDQKKAIDRYFSDSRYRWTEQRVLSVATQTLSKEAVEAYKACINRKNYGVSLAVYDARPDAVTLAIRWVAPPGAPTTASAAVEIAGGSLDRGYPAQWQNNQSFARIVRRDSRRDLRIAVNIGGDSDQELVAYIPPVQIEPAPAPTRAALLYRGVIPNKNAGELGDNAGHKGGAHPIGHAVQEGDRSGQALYAGVTPNRNAGMITTAGGDWRGGGTRPIGYVISIGKQSPTDIPVYVGSRGSRCDGVISSDQGFQNCPMEHIGFLLPP